MMPYIKMLIFLAAVAATAFIVRLIRNKAKFRSDRYDGVLRYPLNYTLSPLLFVLFFAVTTVTVALTDLSEWYYIFLSGAVALGWTPFMIMWSIWKVEVGEEGFVYRNFVGKKTAYRYANLSVRVNERRTKWGFYVGEQCVFTMPFFVTDGERLKKAYDNYNKMRVE